MLKTKIKEYREKAGLKQSELAELVSSRRETIVHLENGRYNPSLKLAMDIAKVFHVTVEELFEFVEDDGIRENLPVVGYMAYFEMKNGYIKRLYWSKEKMLKHADTYSQAFSKNETTVTNQYGTYKKVSFADYEAGNYDGENDWLYSSFWYKNFDEMAKKTMLRQLLSKHGLLSTEMQKAVESDQAVITKDLQPEYVDNENVIDNAAVEKEQTQSIEENSAPTVEEVMNQVNQAQPEPVLEDIDPMQM